MNTILGDEPSWYRSCNSSLYTQKEEYNIGLEDYLSSFQLNMEPLWKK